MSFINLGSSFRDVVKDAHTTATLSSQVAFLSCLGLDSRLLLVIALPTLNSDLNSNGPLVRCFA